MMKNCITLLAIVTLMAARAHAQEAWTVQRCMQYAVEHNHEVRLAQIEIDSHKANRTAAIGSFLPAVEASVGAQYNFGRAIDPETNGYTDVSTFYNGYSVGASLPVFDGFSRLHALRAAKASVLMGHQVLRQKQNLTALNVLQAFVNVVYYDGLVQMAGEKVDETTLLLRQTHVMEEVGRKSAADVAQVEAQKAEADYELTRQQNLLASALLDLKKEMAYPMDDTIRCEVPALDAASHTGCEQGAAALDDNPELLASRYQMQVSMHEWRQARAALYPSLSLSAGINTTYFHTLHSDAGQSFHTQLNNNMGEYVVATLSIPLFNRLHTVTNIRKARNSCRMASESYQQTRLEHEKLSREAWQDWQGYLMQAAQMTKKVEADSMAYQLTRRQYEEGLATAIDLHTTSSQLLNSKATLLQCQLMAVVKQQLVRYYNGKTIWTE